MKEYEWNSYGDMLDTPMNSESENLENHDNSDSKESES